MHGMHFVCSVSLASVPEPQGAIKVTGADEAVAREAHGVAGAAEDDALGAEPFGQVPHLDAPVVGNARRARWVQRVEGQSTYLVGVAGEGVLDSPRGNVPQAQRAVRGSGEHGSVVRGEGHVHHALQRTAQEDGAGPPRTSRLPHVHQRVRASCRQEGPGAAEGEGVHSASVGCEGATHAARASCGQSSSPQAPRRRRLIGHR
mmetsp:Transcript_28585/g.53970  ORF Transcript_28585/g.53970 Transcript_28585/m.53970 type:complete len:203 (-) Transcript_28585:731-1339(-)